jgi:hypothetical protein
MFETGAVCSLQITPLPPLNIHTLKEKNADPSGREV